MTKSFFKTFIHDLGDPDTTVASDGLSSSEFTGYIDTGSYILNAAISGSLYGGIPNNKAVVFAGDPATGKTFFALGVVKSFLTDNKDGHVFYFDTESAVTNEMLTTRGIDITRIAKSEPDSIEKFRHVAYKTLDAYMQLPEDKRFPLLMVLDSLSALPSKKETEDMANEKDVRDMSKATLIKAAFRVLRLKLAKAKVPLIVTNHVYQIIGSYFPTKEMAGGCLVAGTPIVMADGTFRNIEDIAVGEWVKTLDGDCCVSDTFRFTDKPLFEIELETGECVRCSAEHRFLVDGVWVEAGSLHAGDGVELLHNINSDKEIDHVSLLLPDHEYDTL
jgi:RecA/RadA recombinase